MPGLADGDGDGCAGHRLYGLGERDQANRPSASWRSRSASAADPQMQVGLAGGDHPRHVEAPGIEFGKAARKTGARGKAGHPGRSKHAAPAVFARRQMQRRGARFRLMSAISPCSISSPSRSSAMAGEEEDREAAPRQRTWRKRRNSTTGVETCRPASAARGSRPACRSGPTLPQASGVALRCRNAGRRHAADQEELSGAFAAGRSGAVFGKLRQQESVMCRGSSPTITTHVGAPAHLARRNRSCRPCR